MLVNLSPLPPTIQQALLNLTALIEAEDGVSPINESAALGIAGQREADFFFLGSRGDPRGFVVCDARDETLMIGVHPAHRRQGAGTELLTAVRDAYPGFSAWAFGTLPGAAELASRVGMVPARRLLRMERGLGDVTAGPREGIRTFRPSDAADIVALNAAAFAHHPEQGRLTLAEFEQLAAQDWFDAEGLFVAEQDGELAGFHWTKRHGNGLGEVYVIAVAPRHEGRGIGRSLLWAGLAHLASRGDERVQLYVEADQERVVDLYRRAGFEVARIDTCFHSKDPA